MNKSLHHKLGVFGAIPVRILKDRRLGFPALKVYIAISSYEGTKETSYPGVTAIAERAGVARSHVSDATAQLKECGWLEVIQRGRGQTNIYRCLAYSEPVMASSLSRGWEKDSKWKFKKSDRSGHPIPNSGTSGVPNGGNQKDQRKSPSSALATAPANEKRKTNSLFPFKALFSEKYLEQIGSSPPWTGKEWALLKTDFERLGVERLRAAIALFFEEPTREVSAFCQRAGWGYAVFHSQLGKLEAVIAERIRRLSLVRSCQACGRQQEHTGTDCIYCGADLRTGERNES